MLTSIRHILAALAVMALSGVLSACGPAKVAPTAGCPPGHTGENCLPAERSDTEEQDKAEFDRLIAEGPVASDEEVAASTWASAVRKAGVLRVGGSRNSPLFSYFDVDDHVLRGFDAGLSQLLARYVLGDHRQFRLVSVEPGTRAPALLSGEADAVISTYPITRERLRTVSFAGPYFTAGQGLLVMRRRGAPIASLEDLRGRAVAVRRHSTTPQALMHHAPQAVQVLYENERAALNALRHSQVEAYADNMVLLLNTMVRNPLDYAITAEEFGDADSFGIGLVHDSDGVAFINAFLEKIIADGTWLKLWQVTIGNRAQLTILPEPPHPAPAAPQS